MKTSLFFNLFLILITLIACNKDKDFENNLTENYDTIRPLEYFPVFPGSYWIYDNKDTLKVSSDYELYIYNSAAYDAVPDLDTLYLPKLILNGIYNPHDTFAYVKGYSISKPSNSSYRDYAFRGILSETEGFTFYVTSYWTGFQTEGITIKQDTAITINGKKYENVIITLQYDIYWLNLGETIEKCSFLKEFYAKNVGLIRREKKFYPLDTVFKKDIELINYKIIK